MAIAAVATGRTPRAASRRHAKRFSPEPVKVTHTSNTTTSSSSSSSSSRGSRSPRRTTTTTTKKSSRNKKKTTKTTTTTTEQEVAVTVSTQEEAEPLLGTEGESGAGTSKDPHRQILPLTPNRTGCAYCPTTSTSHCVCQQFQSLLQETFQAVTLKRIVGTEKRYLCAKSILPPFVSRLVRILRITKEDTFYDLGAGNGSVLFQVAYMTGAKCVGVELSPHNAQVAREAWQLLKPRLEKLAGRPMPEVSIITGDLVSTVLADPTLYRTPHTVVWTANMLMPRMVTLQMSDAFRRLQPGSRIACFDDLYPHGRAVARLRDPEAFALFEMRDYVWASGTVEWTHFEGSFYAYCRRQPSSSSSQEEEK